jgi:hypothetical protein
VAITGRAGRSARRFALGVVPVLVLGQCAPQCTPTPVPPPVPSVAYTDVSASVPVSGAVFDLYGVDGRFVEISGLGDGVRLDIATREVVPVASDEVLGADGSVVVRVVDDDTLQLRPLDAGAPVISEVSLPAGWVIEAVSTPWASGHRVGVEAINGAFADQAAFVVDFSARTATKLDTALGPDEIGHDSMGAIVPAESWPMAAFTFRDGSLGCRCEDAWVWRPTQAPELVSVSTTGGESGASEVVDISGSGRFVLFHSSSSVVAGGPPDSRGQLFVRDLVTDTTTIVPLPTPQNPVSIGHELNAAISDDGDRIVFVTERGVPQNGMPFIASFPTVFDRSARTWTVLAVAQTAEHTLWYPSNVAMSGDGKRVAYSTIDTAGNVHHIVADLTGG